MISLNKSAKRGLVAILLLVLIMVFFSVLYYFRDYINSSVIYLAVFINKHTFFGIFIFILISLLAVVFSPLSSVPLLPSAIIAWGEFPTFILLFLGWIIGSIVGYFLGYYTRSKIFERFFSLKKIEYYRNRISQDAQFLLVLIFRLAIPSEITAYTLGIIKYDFKKFMIISVISELPFALFAVYSGRAVYEGDFFLLISIVTFTLIFIAFFTLLLNKRFRR